MHNIDGKEATCLDLIMSHIGDLKDEAGIYDEERKFHYNSKSLQEK